MANATKRTEATDKKSGSWAAWCRIVDRWLPDRLFAPAAETLPNDPRLAGPPAGDAPNQHDVDRYLETVERRREYHQDAARTLRQIFFLLIGTCLFCVITLTGALDSELLLPSAKIGLPVLDYDMKFDAFLLVGPLVVVALTSYLHVFMAQIRRFPLPEDYSRPMLPNFESWTARILVLLTFYWMTPLTLAIFAWKAWPRPLEQAVGLGLVITCLAVTALLVVLQMRRTPKSWRPWALPALLGTAIAATAGFVGVLEHRNLDLFKAKLSNQDLRSMDLSSANMQEAKLEDAILMGAELNGANLHQATLTRAMLVRAEARYADFFAADLAGAELTATKLQGADLSHARLFGANLQNATLVMRI